MLEEQRRGEQHLGRAVDDGEGIHERAVRHDTADGEVLDTYRVVACVVAEGAAGAREGDSDVAPCVHVVHGHSSESWRATEPARSHQHGASSAVATGSDSATAAGSASGDEDVAVAGLVVAVAAVVVGVRHLNDA